MRIHEIGFFSRVGGTSDGAGTRIPGFGSSILHFEKTSNMAKNWQKMKKILVQLALKHIFG